MMFIITSLAALALFLFGIDLINSGLSKLFSEQIKKFLSLASKSVLGAILIGGVVTVLIQNSNTPVVMLMGFATSRLIDLRGAIGVILGADIGSTLTVQILSFNLYGFGLFLIAAGFLIRMIVRGPKAGAAASFFTGLGFIFFSMNLLNNLLGTIDPQQSGLIKLVLHNPFIGFAVSLVLTSVIQSSAATIGIAISLANAGFLNLTGALPIILGANIGTCSTAVVALFRADRAGRRVAIAHVLFKVVGVIIVALLFHSFIRLTSAIPGNVAHQIANAHTLFNIMITLIIAPFAGTVARFFDRYVKTGKELELPGIPRYLDESVLSTPSLAFDYALKEIVRLAQYVASMLAISYSALSKNDLWSSNELNAMDDAVESLASKIKLYAVRVSAPTGLTQAEASSQFELITYVKNFEVISSIISQNLSSEIEKKTIGGYRLSDEGWLEIKAYFSEVMQFFKDIVAAIGNDDPGVNTALRERKKKLAQEELLLLKHHLGRLNKQNAESIETSAMHIEIVSILRHITSQLAYMVKPITL